MSRLSSFFIVITAFFSLGIAATSAQEFELEKLSAFKIDNPERNPFWPIGWDPSMIEKTPEKQVQRVVFRPGEHFKITSILLGAEPLAIINGRHYTAGEEVCTTFSGKNICCKVLAIRDGTVIMQLGKNKFQLKKQSSF